MVTDAHRPQATDEAVLEGVIDLVKEAGGEPAATGPTVEAVAAELPVNEYDDLGFLVMAAFPVQFVSSWQGHQWEWGGECHHLQAPPAAVPLRFCSQEHADFPALQPGHEACGVA